MNLLIAFMSDTYERVYDQREKASYAELVKLVLELESLMFWNRNNTEKHQKKKTQKKTKKNKKKNPVVK
jgi:hypothetical protein